MRKIIVGVAPLLLVACAGSHGDQVRDARMEKSDEQADAQQNSVQARDEARRERSDQAYEQRDEQLDADKRPGSDQRQDLNQLSKERADYQWDKYKKLDELAVQIGNTQRKLQVLGPRAPTSLNADLVSAKEQHGMVKQEVQQLSSVSSEQWDSWKKRIDKDTNDLDTRVSQLGDKVDDLK
ncbi:MAG TPA: hypothetical protein VHM19_11945 [Polyangiales bacterium]|jgi:hypothetical protein|nr:hypothetical protein [Polyangiales bacterium]